MGNEQRPHVRVSLKELWDYEILVLERAWPAMCTLRTAAIMGGVACLAGALKYLERSDWLLAAQAFFITLLFVGVALYTSKHKFARAAMHREQSRRIADLSGEAAPDEAASSEPAQ